MSNNSIRVYSLLGKHPIYESIVKYPPRNIDFVNAPSASEFEELSVYKQTYMKIKSILNFINCKLKVPRVFFVIANEQYDLIHSSRGILIFNRKPWVIDFEHIGSFGAFTSKTVKKISLKLLRSKYCRKVLPHSNAAMKSFLNGWKVNEQQILEKLEVLYPATNIRRTSNKNKDKINIGFLARKEAFYVKGGRELLEAFKTLIKKYDNIELIMKVDPPKEIYEIYKRIPNIKFLTTHFNKREELFKNFYEKLDIFVLPTYVDSFGFSLLEAMACGIPLIATNIFAIPEIIEEGKNGFLIKSTLSDFDKNYVPKSFNKEGLKKQKLPEISKQLVEKLSLLIEDSVLRRKMGRYGRSLIEKGKFSIKERNKKLSRIYEEALRH